MTTAAFRRLKTGLAIYCSACEQPHVIERVALRLETADERAPLQRAKARSDLAAE
jgi:hypothetical protein